VRRERVEQSAGSAIATLAELASSGAPVLGICADVSRRHELAGRADPARFGGGALALICGRCCCDPAASARGILDTGGLALADWAALARDPGLGAGFEHVVLVDPPPFAHLEAGIVADAGYVHIAWDAEPDFALKVHESEWGLRPSLGAIYRDLRDAQPQPTGERLGALLAGGGPHPRSAEQVGRCLRVLEELGILAWAREDGEPALGAVSSERTQLEGSGAYVAYTARLEEGRRFLSRQRRAR
jgi:hypothetical protein